MKLILCKRCSQVVSLRSAETLCPCGDSGGRYLDDNQAVYWGEAVPLAFSNESFSEAVRCHEIPPLCPETFAAWVVTPNSRTFTRRP